MISLERALYGESAHRSHAPTKRSPVFRDAENVIFAPMGKSGLGIGIVSRSFLIETPLMAREGMIYGP